MARSTTGGRNFKRASKISRAISTYFETASNKGAKLFWIKTTNASMKLPTGILGILANMFRLHPLPGQSGQHCTPDKEPQEPALPIDHSKGQRRGCHPGQYI